MQNHAVEALARCPIPEYKLQLTEHKSRRYIIAMNSKVQYWRDISLYDLDTAKAMHETGRYLYVRIDSEIILKKTQELQSWIQQKLS